MKAKGIDWTMGYLSAYNKLLICIWFTDSLPRLIEYINHNGNNMPIMIDTNKSHVIQESLNKLAAINIRNACTVTHVNNLVVPIIDSFHKRIDIAHKFCTNNYQSSSSHSKNIYFFRGKAKAEEES